MKISAKKVSEITGISYQMVIKHIRNGDLPADQAASGRCKIDLEDMEYWWWAMYWEMEETGISMYHPIMAYQRIEYYVYGVWPDRMVNPAIFQGTSSLTVNDWKTTQSNDQ